MNSPVFSIVMPAFNSAAHIKEAINSVVKQCFDSWELLIVDDFSTDETLKIAHSFSCSDSRIICLQNCFSKGAAGARSTALSFSRGRYISFLDSDDVWGPSMLALQFNAFKYGNVLCHGNIGLISESGEPLGVYIFPKRVGLYKMIFSNFMANSTVSFDSCVFGRPLVPSVESRNDYALWISLLSSHPDASSVNIGFTGSNYRISGKGLSSASILVNIFRYVNVASSVYPRFLVFLVLPLYLTILGFKKITPPVFNFISSRL